MHDIHQEDEIVVYDNDLSIKDDDIENTPAAPITV